MKKLVVLQPVLAHYRESVFRIMEHWGDYDVVFVAGSEYQSITTMKSEKSILHPFFYFSFLQHKFYYLKGCLRSIGSIKPDIIISSGVDPHLLHTLLVFIYFRIFKGIDFIWWSHGTSGNQGRIGVWVRKFFYRKASGVFTYSNQGKNNLMGWGINGKNIRVIGNAINQSDYGYLNYDIKKIAKNELFTLVFSGRVHKDRRLDILLKAIAILIKKEKLSLKLFIIGDGELASLKSIVIKEGMEDDVVFTGQQYGSDVANYLLKADLIVYPRYIGLSIVQAYSFGVPVITSNNLKKQMPETELLVPGETGDLYEEDDYEDLAKQILKWHHKLQESKDDIREKCIVRIRQLEYLPEIMARKMLNFLDKI